MRFFKVAQIGRSDAHLQSQHFLGSPNHLASFYDEGRRGPTVQKPVVTSRNRFHLSNIHFRHIRSSAYSTTNVNGFFFRKG